MRIVDQNEIAKLVFTRSVDPNIIKGSMIDVAQENYLYNYLGDFYSIMINDDDYIDYIESYFKPIIAWGVLYNNFETISFSITDKGLYVLAAEGGAQLLSRDNKYDSKLEIKRNLTTLIKQMLKIFEVEKKTGNLLFKDFEYIKIPNMINYAFEEKKMMPY